MAGSENWFKGLSLERKIIYGLGSLFGLFIIIGGNSANQTTQPSPVKQEQGTAAPAATLPEIKTITDTQIVPFTVQSVNDANLASGKTIVNTVGVNGQRTITYKVTYTNGVEVSRETVTDVVTLQPITQIVSVGTYITPPSSCGYYTNTYGNQVPSPCPSPSGPPPGASAQCRDGSYSYSQNRRGTCSYHGGVARWL